MSKILVIFGSKSDSDVFDEIADNLDDYELRICSAHRTPLMLEKILQKTRAKVIIAGAGLAAHLPGVIASKTIKPVIGVPVASNFKGLDSLLSIIQMPPGIPVLSVGVNKGKQAAQYAKMMLKKYNGVNIIGDIKNRRVKKAVDLLEEFDVPVYFSKAFSRNDVNINFTKTSKATKYLTINVPLIDSKKTSDANKLFNMTKKGVWVGVGRAENAALAAVQILGMRKKIFRYREEMAEKVIKDDRSI